MRFPIYQIDAFADRVFTGNPAAVVPLDAWLPDEVMQGVAAENNLSETAFFKPAADGFDLRWFTPTVEVDLCGHATLAAAHVLFEHLGFQGKTIRFHTLSGVLSVDRAGDLLALDFPARTGEPAAVPPGLAEALGAEPTLVLGSRPMLALFDDAAAVAGINPDFAKLRGVCIALGSIGVIITASAPANSGWDFVSRLFSPARGIDEDPVTGAAHTVLVPYWSSALGKQELVARQISKRGGTLWCSLKEGRVNMKGRCVDYMIGQITVPMP